MKQLRLLILTIQLKSSRIAYNHCLSAYGVKVDQESLRIKKYWSNKKRGLSSFNDTASFSFCGERGIRTLGTVASTTV